MSIRDEVESILEDRREAQRRTGYGNGKNSVMLELARILFPAILAVGGSWLAIDHRLSVLEAQAVANAVSLQEVKTMLGIGVYKGTAR